MNDISDHLPIFTCCEQKLLEKKTEQFKFVRETKDENICKLKDQLLFNFQLSFSWNELYSCGDVNVVYNKFISVFNSAYNYCCPVKRIKRNVTKPWFTQGLRNACKKKNILYRRFLQNRTRLNETKYKVYKNKLTIILRLAEKEYYVKLLEKNKCNVLASKINSSDSKLQIYDYMKNRNNDPMFIEETSSDEIIKIVNAFSNKSSCHVNDISMS